MYINLLTSGIILTLITPIAVISPPTPDPVEEETVLTSLTEEIEKPQHLVVSSIAPVADLDRGTYSATTMEEVTAIRHDREEKARLEKEAKEAEERKARAATYSSSTVYEEMNPGDNKCSAAGYCWPVSHFTYQQANNGFQTPERPSHNGFDMLTDQGTPIVAVASGTVRLSSENYGAYGAAVVIDSVIDGQNVTFIYAHMTYGTRAVEAGTQVTAGQMIGRVGSTGRSTANHLHLEIAVNGTKIDPHVWLLENAG